MSLVFKMKCVLEYLENINNHNKVIDINGSFTYQEVLEKARKIGSYLGRLVLRNKPVPVFMEKSKETVVTFMGILYAGSFYSLLNAGLPEVRLKQIMNVLDVDYLVTDYEHLSDAQKMFPDKKIYLYEEMVKEDVNDELLSSIRKRMLDSDPVYANFTSGSTGIPKGVVVGNRSIIDFIDTFVDTFNIDSIDVIANQAPFDFDVSVKDIYSALKTGATLVIVPKEYFSKPTLLIEYLITNKVTTLIWAVSALCLISTFHALDYKTPNSINKVLFSGEVMPLKHLKIWMDHLPEATFVNLYGPTEITCNCTYHVIDKAREYTKIPIGQPFNNEEIILIAENNEIVNDDLQKGEICVRGNTLALGYYRNLEQTNKVFVQNPTNHEYRDVIYKTGDIGYYENGELYFGGRKDFQIKYMGHRIELEEIDKAIGDIEGIIRSVVIFKEEKNQLVAFYMGNVDEKELYELLVKQLPIFMVPKKLKKVEDFPLTKNGKIDRKQLEVMI